MYLSELFKRLLCIICIACVVMNYKMIIINLVHKCSATAGTRRNGQFLFNFLVNKLGVLETDVGVSFYI